MKPWMMVAALGIVLSGCAQPPRPEQVTLAAPPGLTLPTSGRAMVYIAQSDLDRKFSYDLNRVSKEETDIPEGQALASASRAVLGKAFAQVATNDPRIQPDVIARVGGTAVYDRIGGTFKVKCEVDSYRADGDPIGHFFNVYKSAPVLSFGESLPRLYAQCLKPAVEEMMRSPSMLAMVRAGFPRPDPAAADAYLRSQGFTVQGP